MSVYFVRGITMICPYCRKDSKHFPVRRTIQLEAGVIRYRRCPNCKKNLRSVEYFDVRISADNRTSVLTKARSLML